MGGRNCNNKKLHTIRIARLFDMNTYEYDFPLKHPVYVIEDNRYKDLVLDVLRRKNVLSYKIERVLRLLVHIKISRLFGKGV